MTTGGGRSITDKATFLLFQKKAAPKTFQHTTRRSQGNYDENAQGAAFLFSVSLFLS